MSAMMAHDYDGSTGYVPLLRRNHELSHNWPPKVVLNICRFAGHALSRSTILIP